MISWRTLTLCSIMLIYQLWPPSQALGASFAPAKMIAPLNEATKALISDALIRGAKKDSLGRSYVSLGDIRFDESALRKAGFVGNPWPRGVMNYEFAPEINASDRILFAQHKTAWEQVTGVRIVENPQAGNRIRIVYEPDPNTCGSSYLGMLGGAQEFTLRCFNSGTISHELGHAYGLLHEHQRSDRDTYLEVLINNVCPGYEGQFAIGGTINLSAYDYRSIMHYPRRAFGLPLDGQICTQNQTTMRPRAPFGDPNDPLNNTAISALDIEGMGARYGWRVNVIVFGNGSGTYAIPGAENCGVDCWYITPATLVTVNTQTDPGSTAIISGPCSGRTTCFFSPHSNTTVRVTLLKTTTLAALLSSTVNLNNDDNFSFADGFE